MGNVFTGLKRAFQAMAEGAGPNRFEVEGRPVRCPHGGHDRFAEGEALLNRIGMTFIGLDWAARTASTWFGQKPTRV